MKKTMICMLLLAALLASGGAAAAAPQPAPVTLRWELLDNQFTPQAPQGRSRAGLTLNALPGHALPAQGWSLYFNCMEGMETGALAGDLLLERVDAGLYRVRPGPGFAGLAGGQTLTIVYYYPNLLVKLSRAPSGPYLVFDASPDAPLRIDDYQLLPLLRPEQLDRGGSVRHALLTAQEVYRDNAQADALPPAALPPIFPTPLQLERGSGSLRLARAPRMDAGPGLRQEAAFAASLFARYLPAQAAKPATAHAGAQAVLRLRVAAVPGQASPEAYALKIGAGAISITGNSAAGVARGLQSLHDLLPLQALRGAGAITLPELAVTDAPRFEYRGFQLDVARNFQPKALVFKVLDLMAAYKLNKLHFHLTDDEGWRLEIAGLPELTAIGAVRGHSTQAGLRLPPAYGSGPYPDDAHGSGYYSRADYLAILRYAAARHIEVIPEIEMPGHARAAVKAMEARRRRLQAAGQAGADSYLLSDPDDQSVYRSAQDYRDNAINPGMASSYAFIEQVVTQVAAMHRAAGVPLRTLHVGGDELPRGAWEKSPASRALMQREQLADMADLWDYFYERVDAILRKQGLYASGWEELGARRAGKLQAPNPRFLGRGYSLYVWNNTPGAEDFAYRLANAGYDTVLAPVTHLYLDISANPNPEEPGVNWGGYSDLKNVYDFKPLDALKPADGKERLTAAGRRHVRGIEATLFSETVRESERFDYLLMPRLLAVAERAWAADPAWSSEADPARAAALHRAAWSGFVNLLGQRVLPRLDLERKVVLYRIAPPGLLLENGRVLVNHVLPGLRMRYTSDGSRPTAASRLVMGAITDRGLIQVAGFDANGRAGVVAAIVNP